MLLYCNAKAGLRIENDRDTFEQYIDDALKYHNSESARLLAWCPSCKKSSRRNGVTTCHANMDITIQASYVKEISDRADAEGTIWFAVYLSFKTGCDLTWHKT
jgi:hypothetical protein